MKNSLIKKLTSSASGLSFLIENTNHGQISAFIEEVQTNLAINDPDIHRLESNNIKIKEVRDLQSFINLKPYNSSYKIAIIMWADKLNLASANALLKTLEEPPNKTFIFLATSSKDEVLPTIVSRCQLLRLPKKILFLSDEEMEKISQQIAQIKKMRIYDKFVLAKKLSEQDDLSNTLTNWLKYARFEMLKNKNYSKICQSIIVSQKILSKYNVNKRLIVENLLLLV